MIVNPKLSPFHFIGGNIELLFYFKFIKVTFIKLILRLIFRYSSFEMKKCEPSQIMKKNLRKIT